MAYNGWRVRDFGYRLAAVRDKTGLSQQDVADLLHIHVNTYARMERGKIGANLVRILELAVALDVPPAELFQLPTKRKKPTVGRPPKAKR